MDKLPRHVRLTLAQRPTASVDEMLSTADNVFVAYKSYGGLRKILTFAPCSFTPAVLAGHVHGRARKDHSSSQPHGSKKSVQFAAAPPPRQPPLVNSDGSSNRSPSLPSLSSAMTHGLLLAHLFCYYHDHFGKEAKRCRLPCKFPNIKRR